MTWTASAIFQQSLLNPLMGKLTGSTNPTTFGSWIADSMTCAMFGTTPTPDKTAAFASIGYNTGVWTTGNETSGTGYAAGGSVLGTRTNTVDSGSSSLCFTAPQLAFTGATLSGVFGDLIYDATITATGSTVTKQGFCYNYFGGSQSVTSGTFTIQWATVGATTAVFNVSV